MMKELSALAATEIAAAGRRKLMQLSLHAVAILFLIAAAAFALSGAHTIIALSQGPVAASFILAGCLLAASLLTFLIAIIVKRRRRGPGPLATAMIAAAPAALSLLPARSKQGGVLAVAAALAAAFLSRPTE